MSLPPQRKADWEAEARYLRNRKQQIEERLAELDEILRLFFGEKTPKQEAAPKCEHEWNDVYRFDGHYPDGIECIKCGVWR